jgi:hypothetical protein
MLMMWVHAETIEYSYDEQDRLIGVESPSVKTEYRYGAANNLSVYKVEQDTDEDGMNDGWEQFYFGNLSTATAMSDTDGDDVKDTAEFISGTKLTDRNSFLKVNGSGKDRGQGLEITWASETNRIYGLERTTNLMVTSSFALLLEDIDGTPPVNVFNDLTATNSRTYYYRIRTREK